MKFSDISVTNAGGLYDYIKAVKESGITYQTEKINVVLSRMIITCEVYEATAFDICGLQKIASSVEILEERGRVDSDQFDDVNIKNDLIFPIKQLGTILRKSEEEYHLENDNRMLPIGCVEFRAIATFRGGAIMGTFGPDLSAFFEVPEGYTFKMEDWMENYIATQVFNTIQKRYTVPLCTQHDVLASAWVESCVYPTIDGFNSPQVICDKIFSDSGKEISFVVDNPQDLLLAIREFKEANYHTANVEFLCKTSVYVFFKLLFSLKNPSWMINHDDFLRLASITSTDDLTILDDEKTGIKTVATRFLSILKGYNEMLASEHTDSPDLSQGQVAVSGISFDRRWLTQLLLIPMSATIRYSIIIPCEYIYKDMVFQNDTTEAIMRMDPRVDTKNDSFATELERLPVFLDKIKSLKLF